MIDRHDSMINPQVELLLAYAGSKFRLVTLASMRARQINAYFGQLGDGLGQLVPPQITSLARKPLSIAFEELAARKIVGVMLPPEGEEGDGSNPAPLVLIGVPPAAVAGTPEA